MNKVLSFSKKKKVTDNDAFVNKTIDNQPYTYLSKYILFRSRYFNSESSLMADVTHKVF